MSMNIRLFPCDVRNPYPTFTAETCFELSSWVSVLGPLTANAERITLPARIAWVSSRETRSVDDIDTDCTWLIRAKAVKAAGIRNYERLGGDKMAYHNAIAAFFEALPDDWPVMVYYV